MAKKVGADVLILNLQREYDSFIKLPEKGFFLGIADYIKYIDEAPELGAIVRLIKKELAIKNLACQT